MDYCLNMHGDDKGDLLVAVEVSTAKPKLCMFQTETENVEKPIKTGK